MKSWCGGVVYGLPLGEDGARDEPRGGAGSRNRRTGARAGPAARAEWLQGVELLQLVDGADHGHVLPAAARRRSPRDRPGPRARSVPSTSQPASRAKPEEAPAHDLQLVGGQQAADEQVAVAVHAPRQLGAVVDGVGGIGERVSRFAPGVTVWIGCAVKGRTWRRGPAGAAWPGAASLAQRRAGWASSLARRPHPGYVVGSRRSRHDPHRPVPTAGRRVSCRLANRSNPPPPEDQDDVPRPGARSAPTSRRTGLTLCLLARRRDPRGPSRRRRDPARGPARGAGSPARGPGRPHLRRRPRRRGRGRPGG